MIKFLLFMAWGVTLWMPEVPWWVSAILVVAALNWEDK